LFGLDWLEFPRAPHPDLDEFW